MAGKRNLKSYFCAPHLHHENLLTWLICIVALKYRWMQRHTNQKNTFREKNKNVHEDFVFLTLPIQSHFIHVLLSQVSYSHCFCQWLFSFIHCTYAVLHRNVLQCQHSLWHKNIYSKYEVKLNNFEQFQTIFSLGFTFSFQFFFCAASYHIVNNQQRKILFYSTVR